MSKVAGGFTRGISERGRFTLNFVMGCALVLFRALTSPLKIPVSCMHQYVHVFPLCNKLMRPRRVDCLRFSTANSVWSFLVPEIGLNLQCRMLQRIGVLSYDNAMAGGSNTVLLGH